MTKTAHEKLREKMKDSLNQYRGGFSKWLSGTTGKRIDEVDIEIDKLLALVADEVGKLPTKIEISKSSPFEVVRIDKKDLDDLLTGGGKK